MIKVNTFAALATAAAIVCSTAGVCRAEPATADLVTTADSWMWRTLFTNTVPLTWNWPNGATTAQLVISGMNSATQTVAFTAPESNYTWTAFSTALPSREEVYQLRLTFYEASAVSEAYTSQLAVVAAAFGPTPVKADTASRDWRKVRDAAVIPYSAAWEENAAAATNVLLTVAGPDKSGEARFSDRLGYYGLQLSSSGWGFGAFDLTLSFLGTAVNLNATLFRSPEGSVISLE